MKSNNLEASLLKCINDVNNERISMRTAIILSALLLIVSLPIELGNNTYELDSEITVMNTHDSGSTVANATLVGGNAEYKGTRNVAGHEWPKYQVLIEEDTTYTTVTFDAYNSFGNNSVLANGIVSYNWSVFFDKPFEDTTIPPTHEFSEDESSLGIWSYEFANITVDEEMNLESEIRIELRVTDEEGNISEKFRMYFTVVHPSHLDSELIIQYDSYQNHTMVTSNEINISGSIQSGSENNNDAYVEIAFNLEDFNASAVQKYNLAIENKWSKAGGLNDSDSFSLMLSLEGMYTNETKTQMIYIKSYEGDDKRWETVYWIEIYLKACQGVIAPDGAIEAGGEFIFDESLGICLWDGVWTYDPLTGEWTAPPVIHEDVVVQVLSPISGILTMSDTVTLNGMVLSSTASPENMYVEAAFSSEDLNASPVDKYDLALDQQWAKAFDLNDTDQFNLTLSLEGKYSNNTLTQTVFYKAYELDSNYQEINIGYGQVDITLIACQGVVAPSSATDAGGEFIYDSALGYCIWDGVWDFDPISNQWNLPISQLCEEWEYWNADLINPNMPGNGCPYFELENILNQTDEEGEDSEEDNLMPSISFILASATILVAALITRRD